MKKITFYVLLCCTTFVFSQSKEFIIVDETTKAPIDLAQLLYPDLEIGSVSNEDGRVKIPLKKYKIIVSHINYQEKEFDYNNFVKKDTLFLTPNTSELDEIVVYNVDILKKIINILDNTYTKEYSTKKVVHNSTYKETFSANDSLFRLFQVQMNWWSKNSLFKANKAIDKQNRIDLVAVDYSKINKSDNDFKNSNGAYVDNSQFFQFAHLNVILSIFKDMAYDIEINSIDKNENSVNVYFDAVLRQKGRLIYKHKNSLLVFDNDYKHIKHLKFNMEYEGDFKNGVSEKSKIPYQKKTTKHIIELSFKKLKNNKLSLRYYTSEVFAILKTKKFTDKIISKQSLFVNESKLGEKLKNGNIPFYEPFYKSVTNNMKNDDVKILLSKKEQTFLDAKN